MDKIKVKVYNEYEAEYIRRCNNNGCSPTTNFQLWEGREVTESELMTLIANGETILINGVV